MMSRFRFRLQPVLEHRARIFDERQSELAGKQRDLADARAEATRLAGEREARRDALTRDHVGLDVDGLRATYAHLAYLDRAIDEHAARVAACRAEVELAQTKLSAANTDRKILETLKTRRYEAFMADTAQVEQRDLDDQNARRFGREHENRGNPA